MIKQNKLFHLSQEFIIERFGNGVIARPPTIQDEDNLSVQQILALPLNVYFLNPASEYIQSNEITLATCGWQSMRYARGKSVAAVWPDKQAQLCLANDQEVIRSQKLNVFEEDVFNDQFNGLQALSFKFPWYDEAQNLIGIFGCSITPEHYPFYSLSNSLALLAKTKLLNAPSSEVQARPSATLSVGTTRHYFTRRELDVLKLLIRAKTSKEIATQLGLSHRTVEHYVENAKRKVGVSSKSELIDRIIDVF